MRACSMNASDIWNEHGTLHSSRNKSSFSFIYFSFFTCGKPFWSIPSLARGSVGSSFSLSPHSAAISVQGWINSFVGLSGRDRSLALTRLQTFEAEHFFFRKWHIPSAQRAHTTYVSRARANGKISKVFDPLVKIDFQLKIDTFLCVSLKASTPSAWNSLQLLWILSLPTVQLFRRFYLGVVRSCFSTVLARFRAQSQSVN